MVDPPGNEADMKKIWLVFVMTLMFVWPMKAQAHIFWLLADQAVPEVGKAVQVEIGFGHKFPKDEEIKAERLQFIKVFGPDGKEINLKKVSTTQYEFVPPAVGSYVVSAQMVPGFVTRTPQGMKMQSKKGIPDANLCFRFDFATKTLVNSGNNPKGFDQSVKSSLEVIPLQNPASLKAGEELPVRVFFQGKPLADAGIKATNDSWNDPKEPFALKAKTDAKGEYRLKLDKPGRWLVIASHKTPYHDQSECDDNMYQGSLTFEVK
jgi:nickel transport protein